MKREAGKVFFASALGAGIGALVALEVVAWLWWIGLIVGGLVGYLSYEFKTVLAALPKAYRAARGWQTPPRYWRNVGWNFLGNMTIMIWLLIIFGSPAIANTPLDSLPVIGVLGSLLVIPTFLLALQATGDQKYLEGREIFLYAFPPIFIFYHLPRGLWWIIRRTPRAVVVAAVAIGRGLAAFVRFLPRFGWQVFIRIHSEMRILCGTDAMLGAAVGYFAGSATIGAVAGGLFGVVNYAFVTERWLRPRGYLPARAK
jgi:hypothetical protein